MPNPQFSVRSQTSKWISSEEKELIYDLVADPGEDKPSNQVPEELRQERENNLQKMEALWEQRVPSPRPRTISPEECARLEALGYTTCGG
jgi:hypothetical protein